MWWWVGLPLVSFHHLLLAPPPQLRPPLQVTRDPLKQEGEAFSLPGMTQLICIGTLLFICGGEGGVTCMQDHHHQHCEPLGWRRVSGGWRCFPPPTALTNSDRLSDERSLSTRGLLYFLDIVL